jgi:CubicO group peptidase (beta-lactamase class C family)
MTVPLRPKTTSLFASLALLGAGCVAESGPLPVSSFEDSRVDGPVVTAALETLRSRARVPALSMCLVEAANVVWCTAIGFADAEAERVVAEDTAFLLASVSKSVTATLVLQQRDAGHFSLETAVDEFLPFAARHPNGPIRVLDLLTHYGAIADSDVMDSFYVDNADPSISLEAVVEGYFTPGGAYYDAADNFQSWSPGEDFEYSNMGFALAGYVAEYAAGEDLGPHSQTALFQPLNMTNTSWRLADFSNDALARPHVSGNTPVEHYTFADYPNGGLRASAPDMARWVAALLNGGTLDDQQILQASTVSEMLEPQADDGDGGTALGWFRDDRSDGGWRMHDGSEVGATTSIGLHPERGVGFVVLTNGDARSGPFADLEAYLIGLAEGL